MITRPGGRHMFRDALLWFRGVTRCTSPQASAVSPDPKYPHPWCAPRPTPIPHTIRETGPRPGA
eukprot:scaffold5340_cov131-Isochrysis_galbana.AAC.16